MSHSDFIPGEPVPYHESLLQWVWKQLRFDLRQLRTGTGRQVTILDPGVPNRSDGPDFRAARIRIGDLTWHGDVEIHWQTRDWYRHCHHENPRFDGVILHVVFHEEGTRQPVERSDGTLIPQLALRPLLSRPLHDFLDRYRRRIPLPCIGHLHRVPREVFGRQIERAHSLYFDRKVSDLLSLWPEGQPLSIAWKEMTGMGLFDGLGIAHNRAQMRRLFVPLTGAILASGTREAFVRRAWFQAGLSGSARRQLRWNHRGSRPGNHPRRRIAQAAAAFWHLWHLPWGQVTSGEPALLWERITAAPPPHLQIGSERRSILYGTVMLPSYWLMGDFLGSEPMKAFAWREWNTHRPRLPESLTEPFARAPIPPEIYRNRLGTIYQLRQFCSTRRCGDCGVFKNAISP